MQIMANTLTRLETIIRSRNGGDGGKSYVAKLTGKGRKKVAQKFGEEAIETIVAALAEDDDALVGEAADTLFHLLILLAERDIPFSHVLAELDRREGISGLDEKAAREA
jgi:phosphoribosyl-ATP pyrophosphohydrolase